ncbi:MULTISPECIES: helix-turn-helix transcriptional regulator [Desulfitobacterium]|uniref:Putative transcriptional regulator n=1 Tax=Desulfitobacterium chlororespirans DSM 11544 TaxID=1121395 RepID=A0A1M7T662_9FIRM|nr:MULTISPECIES: helix-turn-helix transcriptional regulator [Desulfitobacterium]SHN66189.1 putative transcriptional regulator [Desulfitobacterium chlororespirans DSM 11544]
MRNVLIQLREAAGITQQEVADKVGISRSFYGHIENGTRNPSYGLARKISELFDANMESIFFDLDCFRMKRIETIENASYKNQHLSIS